MTTSSERCLGGLLKDIDKDLSPLDLEFFSKDETTYKTSVDQKISLDSIFSFISKSKSSFSFSEDCKISSQNKCLTIFNKSTILSAFYNQKNTLILQKSLKEINKDAINTIIQELSGTFSKIIKNKNGNYFCYDLFKLFDKNQRISVLKEISSILSKDCSDEYGSHPIQTLIELSKCEEEYKLILSSFNDYNKVFNASINQNGSFVIQKIIVFIPERYRMEFNLIFIKFLAILSMDMYGVCTVKKFIRYTKNELIKKQILNIILNNFFNISEYQYGYYLIQYILEYWWNSNEGIYLKKLCVSKFHILATNQYSSYLCDLFIKLYNYEENKFLLSSLIKEKTYTFIYNNKYGNIIINKLINSLNKFKDGNENFMQNTYSLFFINNNINFFKIEGE